MSMRRQRTALAVMLALASVASVAHAQQSGGAREEKPPPAKPKPPELTRPPQLVEGAAPVYPPDALAAGLTADVTVRIHIDATGAPTKVDVVAPAGHGFDEAAVAAAMKYRFSPAEFDGKPGPIVVETTIHFTIAEAPESQAESKPSAEPSSQPTGPSGRLVGTVKERGTRRKLAGVTVAVTPGDVQTITDDKGHYDLGSLPEGNYRIIAVLSGYDRYETAVGVHAGEETDATLYIRPKGASPYESTIEAEKDKLEVTKRTIDRRQMTTVPGTFGDPIRVLQNLPGMSRAPFGLGLLLIRGSNPDDSGTYVDGHRVPLLFHFLGGPSILNPEFLDSIALYPGGFPVRFGRAIGGIVEINTRDTKSDGVHGSADVNLIDSAVYLRAPIGDKVTAAFALRRSYIDVLLPFFLPTPKPGTTLVVVPYYYDYQARVDVKLPHGDKLSFMGFGSYDKLELLQSDAEATFDLNTHVAFNRLRATYTTRLGDMNEYTLTLSPVYGLDNVNFAGGSYTSADVTEHVTGMKERVVGQITPSLHLDTGLDLEYRVTTYTLKVPNDLNLPPTSEGVDVPPSVFARAVDQYGLGGWFELAVDAGHGVKLVPGLRADAYLLAGRPRFSLDPRLVVRWAHDKRTTYKAYVGTFHQSPSAEGFDHQLGNPDLQLEYAYHTGFGLEHWFTDKISIDTEAYWVGRRSQAVFTDAVRRNPDGTITPLYWANEMIGQSFGLEVLLKHEITRHFYGWLSYTLSRAEERRHPDEPWRLSTWDQTHNLILVASYKLDSGWELGVRFRAGSGRPETPIKGGTFDADANEFAPLQGDSHGARRPFFHQLDLRAEKTWLFDTWSIAAYLDIINVYNAENPEATQWDYRFQKSAPVRGIPIVPTLGIKGQW
jgi:TonB family protein